METESIAEVKGLPAFAADWRQTRNESLGRFGDNWIRGGKSAALLVPSAVIRGEWNVLLNPAHLEFARIKLRDPEAFEFDGRMFRTRQNR